MYSKKSVSIACAVGCAVIALPMLAAAGSAEVERLDELALENNQAIHAYDARVRQSEHQAEFEQKRWPQPMVEYMGEVSTPWSPHFQTGHTIRLMQEIPRGGQRDRRAAPARAEAEVQRREQSRQTVELLRDLRVDAVELARIDARLELMDDEIGLLDDALRVLEATAPLDEMGDYGDFYQLELARETAVDRRSELRSRRKARAAKMASRIGVESEAVEELAFDAGVLEEWLIELPERDELVAMATEGERRLASLEAEAQVAAAQIDLVDERTRPSPQLMAGYMNRPPMWEMDGPRDQMFEVGISIPIPIFRGQYDAEASQWQQAQQAVELQRSQLADDVRGEIEELLEEWEADEERLVRHERELLPLARDLAGQVLVGMEVGQRTASDFLTALQQEIELEGAIIELRADQVTRLMEFQRLTGGSLGADQAWAYPEEYGGQR